VSNGAPVRRHEYMSVSHSLCPELLVASQRTNEGDVILLLVTGQTREVREAAEGRDAREDGVSLVDVVNSCLLSFDPDPVLT
jgi:hypothetical protein